MSRWLSPEWFEEVRAVTEQARVVPGLRARIGCELTGGPEGTVRCYGIVEDGRLVGGAEGKGDRRDGAPDVALTVAWDDAVALQQGVLDPSVAFMRGRLRVAGSMEVVTALLPLTATPGYRGACRRIEAFTER